MVKRKNRSVVTQQQTRKTLPSFPQFNQLSIDNITCILAFVGDVPYELPSEEGVAECESMITNVLPYVSKQIYSIIKESDYLWKLALRRLLLKDPNRWKIGLEHFVSNHFPSDGEQQVRNDNIRRERNSAGSDMINEPTDLLRMLDNHALNGESCYHLAIKWIVDKFLRIRSPLFYMPGEACLGERFGLHFFEPRYRSLIAEVMAPFPASARTGHPIAANSAGFFPTFIYGNSSQLQPGVVATIVQVLQCYIYPDGTADVTLEPIAYSKIKQVGIRRNSNNLIEAIAVTLRVDDEIPSD